METTHTVTQTLGLSGRRISHFKVEIIICLWHSLRFALKTDSNLQWEPIQTQISIITHNHRIRISLRQWGLTLKLERSRRLLHLLMEKATQFVHGKIKQT
nr:MAG TPA: hypothetical protein [Caudoviricetes sp.]